MKILKLTAVVMVLAMITVLTGCGGTTSAPGGRSTNFEDHKEEAKEFLRITEYDSPDRNYYNAETSDAASQALDLIVCDALLGYEGTNPDKYGKQVFEQIEADCPDTPDPKNSLYVYEKLEGSAVDQVLTDYFNTEPDHNGMVQKSEGEEWYTWYYEDGYYYYGIEGGDFISFLNDVDIEKVEELSDDTFRVRYNLVCSDDGGEYTQWKEATLKAKKINGQFKWSLVSYGEPGEVYVGDDNGSDDPGKSDGGSSSAALTKDDLHKAFKNNAGSEKELYFLCDDYDADGTIEAFGITGDDSDEDISDDIMIYFISSAGKVSPVISEKIYGYLTMDSESDPILKTGKDKFIVWEQSANGSGSVSYIFGVKNGASYQPDISGKYMTFWGDNSGKNIYVGYTSDFSKGYHDYIENTFTYDTGTHQFVKSGGGNSIFAPEKTGSSKTSETSGTETGKSDSPGTSGSSSAKNLSDSEICKLVYDYAIKNQKYPDQDGLYTKRSLEETFIDYTEGDACLVGVSVMDYESPTFEEDTCVDGAEDVYWYNKKTGEIKYLGATQDDPKYFVDMATGTRKDY